MYRASFLIDRRGMHVLYYSLFLPYFIMYCAKMWGNSYSTSSKCLFMLQKRVLSVYLSVFANCRSQLLAYLASSRHSFDMYMAKECMDFYMF